MHALVADGVDLEGLADVRLEGGVAEGLGDAAEEQLLHGAGELGGDLLRLEGHLEACHLGGLGLALGDVGDLLAGEHLDEGGLARAVLAQEDDDLRGGEGAGLDVEDELGAGLGDERGRHVGPRGRGARGHGVAAGFGGVLDGRGHLEGEGLVAEAKVLRGNVAGEEDVDALADREGHGDHAVGAGHAVEAADEVREVVEHGQVVLHADDVLGARGVVGEDVADDAASDEALLDVEVGGGLVEHVHLRVLHGHHADGEALELTAGEELHLAVGHVVELQLGEHLLPHAAAVEALHKLAHGALDGPGDGVHVLDLDHGLELLVQELGEVALKLGAAEVLENLLPRGRRCEFAQVGLELVGEDLEGRALADTVGSDQPEDLSGTGHGQAVKLEGVGAVAVGGLGRQVGGKVDDADGLEGALLHAQTAADAKLRRLQTGGEESKRQGSDMAEAPRRGATAEVAWRLLPLKRALPALATP